MLKLFLIAQNSNKDYDTFSNAVVCAENEEEASRMHPDGHFYENGWDRHHLWSAKRWVEDPSQVSITYLGEAAEGINKGVICASFHAG